MRTLVYQVPGSEITLTHLMCGLKQWKLIHALFDLTNGGGADSRARITIQQGNQPIAQVAGITTVLGSTTRINANESYAHHTVAGTNQQHMPLPSIQIEGDGKIVVEDTEGGGVVSGLTLLIEVIDKRVV